MSLSLLGVFYTSHVSGVINSTSKRSVVVFKLPRSGSTWFTEILNSYPSVYVAKEIMQRSDVGIHSSKEIENHLTQALQYPGDKLNARTNKLTPSWKFVSEYYLSSKIITALSVVGISLNIEHSSGIAWRNVIKAVPNTKAILLMRGNVVKQAISGYRGRVLHLTCGVSNVPKEPGKVADCAARLPKTVPWAIDEFASNVNSWQKRAFEFYTAVQSIGLPTMQVYYEELQADQNEVMMRIWKFLDVPHEETSSKTSTTALKSSSSPTIGDSAVQKRTSDDLSIVLANFTDIYNFLANPGCECIQQQLRSTKATFFDSNNPQSLCQVLINVPEQRCEAMTMPATALSQEAIVDLRKKYKTCKKPEIHGKIVLC